MICNHCFKPARTVKALGTFKYVYIDGINWKHEEYKCRKAKKEYKGRMRFELCPECARKLEEWIYGK